MERNRRIFRIGLAAVMALLLVPMGAAAAPEPPPPTITSPHFSESCYNADDLDAGTIDDPADPDTTDTLDGPLPDATGTVDSSATSVELYEIPPAPAAPVLIGTDVAPFVGGIWAIPLTAAQLADGYHLLHAIAVNGLGVMKSLPEARVYCVDTIAPAGAPSLLGPFDAAPGDFASCVTNPFVMSGSGADPFATVYIEEQPPGAINGSSLWYTRADGNGDWSIVAHHDDVAGNHTLEVQLYQRDTGRNQSPNSASIFFDICADVTPPAAPIITSPSPGGLPSDATLLITGTVAVEVPALRVFIREQGASPQFRDVEATVDGAGNFSYLETFPSSGAITLTAYAIDASGNKSPMSAPVIKMIDVDRPAVRINMPAGILLNTDPWILSSPTFSGVARDNYGLSHIEIFYDALLGGADVTTNPAVCSGCPTDYDDVADPNDTYAQEAEATWTDSPTLTPGLYEMRVNSVDLAGNISTVDTMRILIV